MAYVPYVNYQGSFEAGKKLGQGKAACAQFDYRELNGEYCDRIDRADFVFNAVMVVAVIAIGWIFVAWWRKRKDERCTC